jgi:hypothetical protein
MKRPLNQSDIGRTVIFRVHGNAKVEEDSTRNTCLFVSAKKKKVR